MSLDLGNLRRTNDLLVQALRSGPYGPEATDIFDAEIRREMLEYQSTCDRIIELLRRIKARDIETLHTDLNQHDLRLGALLDARIIALKIKTSLI